MRCVSLLRAGEPATELWPMFRVQFSARAAFFFRVKPNQPTTFYQAENSIQTLKFHTVIPVLDVVFWKFMLEKIPAIWAWVLFFIFCSFQWPEFSCTVPFWHFSSYAVKSGQTADPIGVCCANFSPGWRVRKPLLCLGIRVNALMNQRREGDRLSRCVSPAPGTLGHSGCCFAPSRCLISRSNTSVLSLNS